MLKRKSIFLLVLIVLSIAISTLLPFAKVHAAPPAPPTSLQWIDRTLIKVNSVYFRAAGSFDSWGGGDYVPAGEWSALDDGHSSQNVNKARNDCMPTLHIDDFDSAGLGATVNKATYYNYYNPGSGCVKDNKVPVTVTSADRRYVTAYRIDDDNVYLPVYKSYHDLALGQASCSSTEFTAADGFFRRWPKDDPQHRYRDDVFPRYSGGNWDDVDNFGVEVHTADNTMFPKFNGTPTDCTDSKPITFANGGKPTDPGALADFYANVKSNSINGGAPGTPNPHIDCSWSINPLTWIMCPLLDLAQSIINGVGQFITAQLEIDANTYFNKGLQDKGQNIYAAWNSVRLISMSFLVIIALVMVIAQALSLDIVDAYTVKKVLPRLAAAVIAISLSWELGRLAVIFSNDLAKAVQSIIYAPFKSITAPDVGGLITSVGAVGAVAGVQALGPLGLLAFLGTAAVALIIAFVAIILRQIIVVFLVIIAPIAIIAAVLPNTQKLWKIWHETFTGALLVYSIIAGLIAAGAVFGQVAGTAGGAAAPLIALIATYIPYFLIPKAFSMASGLIGTLGGMVNDRSRGVFDGLRKIRRNKAAERVKKFRGGGLYSSGTRRGRFGNKVGSYLFNADEVVPHTLGKHGIPGFGGAHTRLDSKIRAERQNQTMEFAKRINEVGGNDQTGRVLSGAFLDPKLDMGEDTEGRNVRDLLESRFYTTDSKGNKVFKGLQTEQDWDDAATIMGSSDSATVKKASDALLALKGEGLNLNREGKGYTDMVGAGGMIVASHGFANEGDVQQIGQNMEAQHGRAYSDTMMTQMEVNGASSGLKATYSHSRDKDGKIITGTTAGRGWDRALSKGYHEIAGQKKHAVVSDVAELSDIIRTAEMSPAQKQARIREKVAGGMDEAIATRQVMDSGIGAKATAAKKTLEMIALYSPGASDSYTVATQAMSDLGMSIPGRPEGKEPDAGGPPADPTIGGTVDISGGGTL